MITLASFENLGNTFPVAAKSVAGISLLKFSQDKNYHVFNYNPELDYLLNRGFFIPSVTVSKNYGGLDRSTLVRRVLVSGKANPVQFTTQRLASLCGDLKHHKEAIMPNTISLNEVASSLHVDNGQAVVSSKVIADQFGKSHKDVLRAISNLKCSEEFRRRNFALSNYMVQSGRNTTRTFKCFDLTKDGFVMTVMGFTGSKADQFKEAYIQAFNQMEAELVSNTNKLPVPHPIDSLDFIHQRWLVVVENGEVMGRRLLNTDEYLFNRKQFINFFKEPNIGFNQMDQLMELSKAVNDRLIKLAQSQGAKC
jgi:Rha family phage regulatory protein